MFNNKKKKEREREIQRLKSLKAFCYSCYNLHVAVKEVRLVKIHNAGLWVCPVCNIRYTTTAINLLWDEWAARKKMKPLS